MNKPLPAPLTRQPGDTAEALACVPVFEEICVNANGDIVCSSCDVNGQRVYGNVFRDRIADVYDGPIYQEMRRWLLASRPDSWCPATGYHCSRRTLHAATDTPLTGHAVKTLKLEPTSHCNLACPVCPVVTNFVNDPDLAASRGRKLLPLATMLDVVDQLPDLEQILYFNFGEPFLNKATIPFLREVRRRRPKVRIATNTNGLAMSAATIEALAGEALMDKIVVSIDGAFPESYRRYRVGGELEAALGKLAHLAAACRKAGTADRVKVLWQYILFEWNDSDAELAEAKRRAAEMGVEIWWVVTSGFGASKRFLEGSAETARLLGASEDLVALSSPTELYRRLEGRSIDNLSVFQQIDAACRLVELPTGVDGPWRAELRTFAEGVEGPRGGRILVKMDVGNLTEQDWRGERTDGLRLGVLLQTPEGRTIEELHHLGVLPASATRPNGDDKVDLLLTLPAEPGQYRLMIDVVQEGVTWFHERGSTPLTLPLAVA